MKQKFLAVAVAAFCITGFAASVAHADKAAQPAPYEQLAPEAPVSAPAPVAKGIALILFGFALLGTVTQNALSTFDANNLVTTALPAANANNVSAAINLFSTSAGRIPRVEVDISVPALPALADTKNLTLTLQDSADGVTFAAVADIPPIVITGAGGVGAAAVARRFKLPITVRQYIALAAAVDNAGGNNTAVSTQLALVF